MLLFKLLLLLLIANGSPILVRFVTGDRWSAPIDGGRNAWDGRPLFGKSKTWRGAIGAIAATAFAALLLGLDVTLGAGIGALAMAGDLLSSFVKRRLGIPSSGPANGLDQVPESLLPLLGVGPRLELDGLEISGLVAAFWILELWLSRWLYAFKIRNRPW
jgi:CDP-2,3-bis-(O-geranylgeranyl)-sn-glycerol synthase